MERRANTDTVAVVAMRCCACVQFYPADPMYQQRSSAPADALNITPVLVRPRAIMDVYTSLQQRWAGAGAHALRAQVLVGKEMDRLEGLVQAALPAVHERNAQLKMLNEQLQQCRSHAQPDDGAG